MDSNFEETKQATFTALRGIISGDVEIVIGMVNTLLELQAEDIKQNYDDNKIAKLNEQISELEKKASR